MISISKPTWSEEAYIFYNIEDSSFFKTLSGLNEKPTLSNGQLIGDYNLSKAFPLAHKYYVAFEAYKDKKKYLIIYNLNTKEIVHKFTLKASFVSLKESSEKGVLIGCFIVPGEICSRIIKYDINNFTEREVVELEGEIDSLLLVDKKIFAICKDLTRSDEAKSYFIYPRNLYVINDENVEDIDVFDWVRRKGEMFGYDKDNNKLIYAINDNDKPNIWIIKNTDKILSRVKNFVR